METNREKYFTGFSRGENVSMFIKTTTAYCVNRSHHRRQNFDSHETIAFLIKRKHITCGKCQGFEVKIRLNTFKAEIRQRLSQQKTQNIPVTHKKSNARVEQLTYSHLS